MNNFQAEQQNIWKETIQVRFGNIDRSDRLTLASVFNFFQEAAISHADKLGAGRYALAQNGQVWILSRMSVRINKRPRYGDTITVRTWPRGGEKLFAIRDYDICDSEGSPLIQARSSWLIIDINKRRPLRPQIVIDKLPLNDGINALPCGTPSLCERQDLQKIAERNAVYSEIDYNGHVNNVSYIQWIQDAVQSPLLENATQLRLDINYLNEVLPGETVEIRTALLPESAAGGAGTDSSQFYAFEGRIVSNGQPAFRAELRLERV